MAISQGYPDAGYGTTPDIAVAADDRRTQLLNRVSWGAILAGVVSALVVQLLLNVLGLGLGAGSLDAGNAANNPDASTASLTAAVWWIASGVVASFIGGIVAGRLSGAATRGTASWHGFVAWCTSTLVIVVLLTSAIGGILGGTFNALSSTVGGVGRAAASAVGGVAQGTSPDALQAQVRRLVNPNDGQSVQDDVIAYVRASLNSDQNATNAAHDRAVNSLAKAANVSPDEAKTRLDDAAKQYKQGVEQAKQQATQAAEAARKGVASAGLYGFAALLLGAVAGFLGGAAGAPRRAVTAVAFRD